MKPEMNLSGNDIHSIRKALTIAIAKGSESAEVEKWQTLESKFLKAMDYYAWYNEF